MCIIIPRVSIHIGVKTLGLEHDSVEQQILLLYSLRGQHFTTQHLQIDSSQHYDMISDIKSYKVTQL